MKIKPLKAQNGNSFLLSFLDDGGIARNILIDGGTSDTYYSKSKNSYGDLKKEIDSIKERKEVIDLLILTHIDNDHICGLLEWFRRDDKSHNYVKNVWFNSSKLIASNFEEPENEDLRMHIDISSDPKTAVKEALQFENFLINKGIWNENIIIQGQEFIMNGLEILVLSPNEAQLKKLLKEYRKSSDNDNYTAGQSSDWHINIQKIIDDENRAGFKFVQDKSQTNGSSISVIITFHGKNYLFLGDSHPNELVEYLENKGYSTNNPLKVDLMQVSHHGSKGNTNKELLAIIKTDNYLISTDSSVHRHPDKRTLARILNVNPDAVFYFNYAFVRDNIFNTYDRIDYAIRARVIEDFFSL